MNKFILFFAFTCVVLTTNAQDTIATGICGDNLTWTLTKDSVLTISGNGETGNFSYFESPWISYKGYIKAIVIEDGVTSIGHKVFFDCQNLISINISKSVTAIGKHIFDNCFNFLSIDVDSNNIRYSSNDGILYSKLQDTLVYYPKGKTDTIIIPNSVTTIGYGAFGQCFNLISITIPESIITIEMNAFMDCLNLTSITIPNSVTKIGVQAFVDCSSLTSIIIPDSVSIIESGTFGDCNSLTSVHIGNSVTTIKDCAFINCYSLTSVTIPNSVNTIYPQAFQNCSGLKSVLLGDSVGLIGNYAFANCTKLDTIVCKPNRQVPIIYEKTFQNVRKDALVYVPCYRADAYRYSQWGWGDKFNDFIEMCVGIEEPTQNGKISVFPNPTTNQLRIANYELREGTENYTIYNVVGQKVMQGVLQGRDAINCVSTINVEPLAKGMYYLRIAEKTVKFIKE